MVGGSFGLADLTGSTFGAPSLLVHSDLCHDGRMHLDIVILSHLVAEPVHGYELKRKVARTTAFVLHNNSLYPALRRFEEAGAVVKTAHQQEGKPPRHIYEVTDVGRELLHDMLAELPAELAGSDEEFLTRLGMFGLLTPDERRGVLTARAVALEARAEHLKDLAERAADSSSGHQEWGGLVVAELLDRVARDRAWVDRLINTAG
jgi:DNA-binding PadR family transcriptional regulator